MPWTHFFKCFMGEKKETYFFTSKAFEQTIKLLRWRRLENCLCIGVCAHWFHAALVAVKFGEEKKSNHLSCGRPLFPLRIQNALKPKSFTLSMVSLKCHFHCEVVAVGAVKTATLVFSVLTSVCQMFGLLHAQSCLAISLKNTRTSKQTAALATLLLTSQRSPYCLDTFWRIVLFHQQPSNTIAGQRHTIATARVCVAKWNWWAVI